MYWFVNIAAEHVNSFDTETQTKERGYKQDFHVNLSCRGYV